MLLIVIIPSVQKVIEWEIIPAEEIGEEYEDGIFDSPDPSTRSEIALEDLETHPLYNESGQYIPLYDLDGYPIQRRLGVTHENGTPLGILVNSKKLKKLFACAANDSPDGDAIPYPSSSTTYYFYPQAGLRTVGHFQANGLPTKCYPLVHKIDRDVQDPFNEPERGPNDNDNHDGIGNGNPTFQYSRQAVFGISSQGYNVVMHRTRGRTSQHHDAQVGLVTAVLGGAWAGSGTSQSSTARSIEMKCTRTMPHKAFADKIRNEPLDRDLRMENVYCIDVNALHLRFRNGRCVYRTLIVLTCLSFACSDIFNQILYPLTKIWQHGTLVGTLRKHVQLFTPQVSNHNNLILLKSSKK